LTEYSITITGNLLGGVLTIFAAATLGKEFPRKVTAYSLVSPHAANPLWINYVASIIPQPKLVHFTNQNDTIPSDLTEVDGHVHHRTHFWRPVLRATPDNMVIFNGREDPSCNKIWMESLGSVIVGTNCSNNGVSVENTGFARINKAYYHHMNVYFLSTDGVEC